MKIVNVEVFKFTTPPPKSTGSTKGVGGAVNWPTDLPWAIYPDIIEHMNKNVPNIAGGAAVVKITAENGMYGYGSTGLYRQAAEIIEDVLKPFLIGQDCEEIEYLWHIMYLKTSAWGRAGLAMQAISAVDIALWDLKGKITGQPVYQLLGGKVRDKIKVYATGLSFELYRDMGYKAVKVPRPYGLVDGKEGMRKTVECFDWILKTMGDDTEIAIDVWCAWDVEYTIKISKMLRDYNLRWVEEPVPADDYDGYRRIKDILNAEGILVSGGEHEFSRWGTRKLVENQCVDILQSDIWYTGGLSEIRKINALAKAHNLMLVPHCHGMPVFHFSVSSLTSPFAETLLFNQVLEPSRLFLGEPKVVDGYIDVPDKPGLGYELNYDWGPCIKLSE
ncbi:MAG: hypothetical protein IKM38_03625 [Christensenellaceae bacterium]|nr:hypothetical protein [Christensenellaceae bacterium]